MKLINLVENTPGAEGCQSAHGLSFYIETQHHRLLMDAGPGPVLVDNADALGVDLSRVDTVVLSHGHYDHADGLPAFARRNPHAAIYLHKGAEQPRFSLDPKGYRYNGMDPDIAALPNLVWTQGRVDLDEELSLFDGASHEKLWPRSNRRLFCQREGQMVQDPFDHEQYLVVREDWDTRVLLSGCAHQGIVRRRAGRGGQRLSHDEARGRLYPGGFGPHPPNGFLAQGALRRGAVHLPLYRAGALPGDEGHSRTAASLRPLRGDSAIINMENARQDELVGRFCVSFWKMM